ncbi:TPA: LysR family transcriptional regulator [Burkholderia vietnamiensis]|nr:LysR family transcriptional regulator [Burkholderia vietnamiensis]
MDLRQMRYFVAVAECRSISVAARLVHVAQPALTRQMHALEEELGTSLFDRTTRGVSLTDAGKQLLADATKLLDDAATAMDRVRRAGRGEIGHLSIALPIRQAAAPEIAGILKTFRREVPGVSITLSHLLSEAQLKLLSTGQLDAGFLLFRPEDDSSLNGIPVCSKQLLLFYPADWQWERGKPESLRDLNDVDFIWVQRSAAPAWHDSLVHCFFDAGFVPKVSAHGVDAGSMLTLVSAGMGCTVLPEMATSAVPKSVACMRVPDLDVVHKWEFVWRKDRCSSVLRRFIDVVTAYVRQ